MESIKEILSSQHLFQSAVAVCFSECIRDDSVRKVTCFNRNIALWKDSASCIRAVEDRCPHRGAPLSKGAVVGDYISCPYHGWQFNGGGLCNTKLRSSDEKSENYPNIISFQAIERFGLVWLSTDGFSTLEQLPHTNSDNFVYHFSDTIQAEAFLVMENLFDVNHFPYVHSGSFSSVQKQSLINCSQKIIKTSNGFRMTYNVPISPSGEFSELFDNAPKNAYVSTEYLAPFIQLFHVVYDCGVDYRTAQIVLPISPRCTRLFQICWEFSSGSDEANQNLLLADKKVWMEDKRIIEACSINSGDMLDTYYNEDHSKFMIECINEIGQ